MFELKGISKRFMYSTHLKMVVCVRDFGGGHVCEGLTFVRRTTKGPQEKFPGCSSKSSYCDEYIYELKLSLVPACA